MTNRRVGTITAGIFLVALGTLLMLNLITGIKLPLSLIQFWPVILITLGLEILFYHYRVGQDDKLRYDIISMFVLLLVGVTAVGLYAFQMSGIGNFIENLSRSSKYTIELPNNSIPVEDTIERIEIDNDEVGFNVRIADTENIEIMGSVNIVALNKKEARRLVDENKGYAVKRRGDSLLLKINPIKSGHLFIADFEHASPLTIVIPSRLALDIISNNGDVSVFADKIDADIFAKQNAGSIDVVLRKNANADITADTIQVEGALKFKVKDTTDTPINAGEKATSAARASEYAASGEQERHEYYATLGKGGHIIHLINPYGRVGVYLK